MSNKLIVKDEVLIEASPPKIWEVLTLPKYVSQWDELPEDYPDHPMTEGSEVVWNHPNSGRTITKIIKAMEPKELKIALYSSTWEEKVNEGDISYIYKLENRNGSTLLKIEIGDFSLLADGQKYYDASAEFAAESKHIIKKLAENL